MINSPVKNGHSKSCRRCLNLITEPSEICQNCEKPLNSAQPKSLFGKIKNLLGIELSSELISLHLEEPEPFLTQQEIETLLETENITVLGLEDVPNPDTMFYTSKRVRKPFRRNKP